mgnify:FL=1
MLLKDKVAIITGGTRGIGFETARQFIIHGAKVAICGSRQETVNKALDKLKTEFPNIKVLGFYPNLTNEQEVIKMYNEVENTFGKIDILINNAGISSSTPIEKYTEDEFNKIINLNIKSVFICSKTIIPFLKKTKGVILNTSSMVSKHGQPAGVMYPASKFAVNGITISLARELAPKGIRVNAVAPGITNTDMVKALPEKVIAPLIKTIPLGRIGEPKDIANTYVFLASNMASYITGEIIHVDGCART